MGFFKNLFNDIKTYNTPIANYKGKITDYINFISVHSFGQSNLSKETAERKSIAMTSELYELGEKLDPTIEFVLYLPQSDLNMNVATSVKFINELDFAFKNGKQINQQLINYIVDFKISNKFK